jgi:hypothetical protein
MYPLPDQFNRRMGLRIEPKNSSAFVGPEHLPCCKIESHAATMGDTLSLVENCLAADKIVLDALTVLNVRIGSTPSGDLSVFVPQRHAPE